MASLVVHLGIRRPCVRRVRADRARRDRRLSKAFPRVESASLFPRRRSGPVTHADVPERYGRRHGLDGASLCPRGDHPSIYATGRGASRSPGRWSRNAPRTAGMQVVWRTVLRPSYASTVRLCLSDAATETERTPARQGEPKRSPCGERARPDEARNRRDAHGRFSKMCALASDIAPLHRDREGSALSGTESRRGRA